MVQLTQMYCVIGRVTSSLHQLTDALEETSSTLQAVETQQTRFDRRKICSLVKSVLV